MMEQLIVGVKRGANPPEGWFGMLQRLAGVKVLAHPNERMARIEATPEAEARLREELGSSFNIEHPIKHY